MAPKSSLQEKLLIMSSEKIALALQAQLLKK